MAQAFVLAIWVTLKPGMVDKWLEAWKPVAEHVRLHEPDTLAYEVSVAEDNPDRLFIYERYTTKAHLADPHQLSKPFLAFKEEMNKLDPYLEKDGKGTFETGIGHVGRP